MLLGFDYCKDDDDDDDDDGRMWWWWCSCYDIAWIKVSKPVTMWCYNDFVHYMLCDLLC